MTRPICFLLLIATIHLTSGCAPLVQSLFQSWVTIARVETTGTTEPVAASQSATGAALCPAIARPAMLLFLPSDAYALFDPASGTTCPLSFAAAIPGMAVMAQNDFFVASRTRGPAADATVIQRYRADGTVEALPYTLVDAQTGAALVAFAVSEDARLLAWSILGPVAGDDFPATSLSISDLETGIVQSGIVAEPGGAPRTLVPIHFNADGSQLYYARQPVGLGGIWSSYVGRYANLYAVSTAGAGARELIFDCAEFGLGLCLGDFYLVDNIVNALAYVDRQASAVVIQNREGTVLNTLQTEQTYIGYPTWGPGGELVYYTAELAADPGASPAPALGSLQRVAPPTAPSETLASDPALLLPIRFLNATQVVVGWVGENDSRALALVGIDGTVELLDAPVGATLLAGPAVSTLLGSSGGLISTP